MPAGRPLHDLRAQVGVVEGAHLVEVHVPPGPSPLNHLLLLLLLLHLLHVRGGDDLELNLAALRAGRVAPMLLLLLLLLAMLVEVVLQLLLAHRTLVPRGARREAQRAIDILRRILLLLRVVVVLVVVVVLLRVRVRELVGLMLDELLVLVLVLKGELVGLSRVGSLPGGLLGVRGEGQAADQGGRAAGGRGRGQGPSRAQLLQLLVLLLQVVHGAERLGEHQLPLLLMVMLLLVLV